MEALRLWWQKRSVRDRRALVLLAIVAPLVLGWWAITRPMLDDREMLQREKQGLQTQVREMERLVEDFVAFNKDAGDPTVLPSASVLTRVETFLRKVKTPVKPTLHRAGLTVNGTKYSAAELRFARMQPDQVWEILRSLASEPFRIASFELIGQGGIRTISGNLLLWLPH